MGHANFTTGGRLGYSSVKSRVSLKVPKRVERVCDRACVWARAAVTREREASANLSSLLFLTSVPGRVLRPEDDRVPAQDVVRGGGAVDAGGRILLQLAEVAHEALGGERGGEELCVRCGDGRKTRGGRCESREARCPSAPPPLGLTLRAGVDMAVRVCACVDG